MLLSGLDQSQNARSKRAASLRWWRGGALVLALLAPLSIASAQNLTGAGVSASAPVAPLPVPSAPDINILILALDDLNAAPAPIPFLPPPPVPPIAPAGAMPITPTGAPNLQWQWRAWAQKKTKEEKKREAQTAENQLFNAAPAPPTLPAKQLTPAELAALGQTAPANAPGAAGAAGIAPGNNAAANNGGAPVYVPGFDAIAPTAPGKTQLLALSLRRYLNARGFQNVQVTTLDGAIVAESLRENRLTPRVTGELRNALAQLAQAPDPSALIRAGRAASRVGQATGYRAVVALNVGAPSSVNIVGAATGVGAQTQKVTLNMVVADAQRESVEPLQFVETGDNENIWRETGASTGADLLDKTLRDWPATSSTDRARLAQIHFDAAQSAFQNGDLARAQDELNQSISLDGARAQAFVLRGDILQKADPQAAAIAYRRAVDLNVADGATWAKIAATYAYAQTPDWPNALSAGEKALAANYDSAALRVAMATAQYGRADLFRKADYPGKAEEAETKARAHLDRALDLAPDDPSAVRLLARNLIANKRFAEAARTLDRIAPRYPDDVEIQAQYALSLGNQVGRENDAFAAYARVWKLTNQKAVNVDALTYRTLASGFDQRLFNLGKVAVQLSQGRGQSRRHARIGGAATFQTQGRDGGRPGRHQRGETFGRGRRRRRRLARFRRRFDEPIARIVSVLSRNRPRRLSRARQRFVSPSGRAA